MSKPSRVRAYGQNIPLIDVMPLPVFKSSAPTSADKSFEVGAVWIYNSGASSRVAYIFGGLDSSQDAIWILAAPGASDVDTLTGDSGGALSPAGGNITLAGGTNITSVGSGSTITFNMDATVVLATSMSSPIYTVAAATDLAINAVSGQDIIMKMGDNAGANKVSFLDSDDAEVFAIDSNGDITYASLSVAGAFTQTAGVVSISEDNSANAVGIANGTTARAVSIASSAAAHTVAIGSATGAASLDLKAGTGNFTLDGAATTTMAVGASLTSGTITIGGTAQTGNLVIGTSSGTMQLDLGVGAGATTVNIASGATGANAVNIGSGAIDNVVIIGSATAASSVSLLVGTGNFALDGAATSTYAIGASTTSGTITIGGTAQTGNLVIGTSSGTMQLDLGVGAGATTVNIASGATGANAVNIGTGAIDNVVIIGSASAASSLALLVGTGNFSLGGAAAATMTVGGTAQTGTITLGDSSATNIVEIGAGEGATTVDIAGGATAAKAVNIAVGAVANVVTIGSASGAASLALLAGTGRIAVTGTVKEIDAEFLNASGDDISFQMSPTTCTAADTAGVATGATGDLNMLGLQQGVMMEQFILGAGQTIIKPVMDANGLLVSGDLTATEGFEYNWGAARSNSRHAFTIGTSAAFFIEWQYTVADVSGASPYMCGFRKVEANNATLTGYTDYAMIGLDDVAAVGNVVLKTELNSGGTTNTDTTDAWANAATHTVKVLVSAAGVVTYLIDGIAPSVTAAYTFDNTDVVVPFFRLEHKAGAPGAVNWNSVKVGFQA